MSCDHGNCLTCFWWGKDGICNRDGQPRLADESCGFWRRDDWSESQREHQAAWVVPAEGQMGMWP